MYPEDKKELSCAPNEELDSTRHDMDYIESKLELIRRYLYECNIQTEKYWLQYNQSKEIDPDWLNIVRESSLSPKDVKWKEVLDYILPIVKDCIDYSERATYDQAYSQYAYGLLKIVYGSGLPFGFATNTFNNVICYCVDYAKVDTATKQYAAKVFYQDLQGYCKEYHYFGTYPAILRLISNDICDGDILRLKDYMNSVSPLGCTHFSCCLKSIPEHESAYNQYLWENNIKYLPEANSYKIAKAYWEKNIYPKSSAPVEAIARSVEVPKRRPLINGKAKELYDRYSGTPEIYRIVLAEGKYIKQQIEAARPTKEEIRAAQLKQEYEEAVESQKPGEPWRIRYSTYPCPHCGHYKVRYANWDDKKLSISFWGHMSDAIGKAYKCEYCRRMW